ncbi:hypothetical protein C9374_012953 [Naegleria lovaniensis]|uniref:Uncharacterized protein n=1 Tax=Naegleria lovaniensis TaxID=51637 RepID=A0AA88KBD6_NAELO|nr:uncharacterized protein C9374_012953 [Naegleria lovaniensis]KAG2373010.1 hypothetical protein C9374_012953 [Naegleria lovaniensis]
MQSSIITRRQFFKLGALIFMVLSTLLVLRLFFLSSSSRKSSTSDHSKFEPSKNRLASLCSQTIYSEQDSYHHDDSTIISKKRNQLKSWIFPEHDPKTNFEPLLAPNPQHEKYFSNRITSCSIGPNFGVICGLTNQLFEIITCMALSRKLGAKKMILSNVCSNGAPGLCKYCNTFSPLSEFFNIERIQTLGLERFGLTLIDSTQTNLKHLKISKPMFSVYNRTWDEKPLAEAVDAIFKIALHEKTNFFTHNDILNLGFVWGRWLPTSDDEISLYLHLFDLFEPNQYIRRVMNEFLWRVNFFDSVGRPFMVIHNQFPKQESDSYQGCQRTQHILSTSQPDFFHFLKNDLKLNSVVSNSPSRFTRRQVHQKGNSNHYEKKHLGNDHKLLQGMNVLLIGSGFENKNVESLRLSDLADENIFTYTQSDLMPLTRNHQFHNSVMAMWMAMEADYFVATTCESQFLSHVIRIRQLLKKPVCSMADIAKSMNLNRYDSQYLKNVNKSPYYFPHHVTGRVFLVDKCQLPFVTRVDGNEFVAQ